ncbi:Scarecrow-like protein 3 [Dichanthelium oligosanthes]|uniref:Scarecrow-like protein 3 n=1 Tax=Dichanthelium oligosanthes TaxID=888268 RepID=A0A1E5VM94_9POAL|nr:Scarecrow-like protein 3 [Dichanthelium oligosanthes]
MVQDEGSSSSVTSSPLHNFSNMPLHPAAAAPTPPWMLRELRSDERGLCLIHLLLNCAAAAAAGRLDAANAALEHIATLAAPDGDAMQRVAAAFAEALARRALRAWPGLCRALLLPRAAPAAAELAAARRHFLDLCPFLRLAGAAANQSILEAMESEKIVHVIDLGGADATQWLELLHLLAARPEGPPHLRLTAVHEHKDVLTQTAMVLTKEAERLDVPFQFNPVVSRLDALDVESLRVKTGEALAITSSLQLHCLLASDDDSGANAGVGVGGKDNNNSNKERRSPESGLSPSTSRADAFLGALWGLSPKVMVVTEQEASHNAPALTERFVEALNYYAALFDCLEVVASRGSVERARVERWLLGEEIKNIVACDGVERRERHERLERWARRVEGAGFGRVPLSYYALLQARRAAQGLGCDGFKVREEKGSFFLCWQDRPIFSVSAWRGRRFD